MIELPDPCFGIIVSVLANVACFATVKLSNLGKTRAGIKELH